MRAPEHLRKKAGRARLRKLRATARAFRARYGAPIYLVGSALLDFNSDPRDWDVRIILPDEDFRRMFGEPRAWETQGQTGIWGRERWRWSDDCVKQSKDFYFRTGLNVDLQIYPRSYSARVYRRRPRYQLA